MSPELIALRTEEMGALWPTSLRRIDWKRMGFKTSIASTIQRIAGFQ